MAFIICIAALIIMMFVFTKMLLSFGITCSVGTCHIWHGKKRMTAHILSYRRIRRYLALSLKATEEHVTLVM